MNTLDTFPRVLSISMKFISIQFLLETRYILQRYCLISRYRLFKDAYWEKFSQEL